MFLLVFIRNEQLYSVWDPLRYIFKFEALNFRIVISRQTFTKLFDFFFIFIRVTIFLGVPTKEELTLDDFGMVLMKEDIKRVEMNNLVMNKDRKMTRIKQFKTAMTDVSLKMFILPDKITCRPFEYTEH